MAKGGMEGRPCGQGRYGGELHVATGSKEGRARTVQIVKSQKRLLEHFRLAAQDELVAELHEGERRVPVARLLGAARCHEVDRRKVAGASPEVSTDDSIEKGVPRAILAHVGDSHIEGAVGVIAHVGDVHVGGGVCATQPVAA